MCNSKSREVVEQKTITLIKKGLITTIMKTYYIEAIIKIKVRLTFPYKPTMRISNKKERGAVNSKSKFLVNKSI